MKREMPRVVFFGIIVVALIAAGTVIWYYSESPWNRPGGAAAIFEEKVRWAKARGIDLRKDPLAGPVYYHFHPEETPKDYDPLGVKKANAAALAAKAAKQQGAGAQPAATPTPPAAAPNH